MAKKQAGWQTISLQPLTGPLDARYRPTESPDAGFKWKQNFCVSENGKLSRRLGFQKLFSTSTSGGEYTNWDFHQRGAGVPRKPLTFLEQIDKSDGSRQLFAGDQNTLSVLSEQTGVWTDIATGFGATGSPVWQADVLQDTVIFTNDVDAIQSYNLDSPSNVSSIPDLVSLQVTQAKTVIQFQGVIMLMNTVEGGQNTSSRIRWSDLNLPLSYVPSDSSISGYQDLPYGDELLGAIELQGSLYIFTKRSIWRSYVGVNAAGATSFQFTQIYTDPQNSKGCLFYSGTLCSDGYSLYWGSREAFYTYNVYLVGPETPEWLRQATGVMYTNNATLVDPTQCLSAIAEFRPVTNEVWISWPSQSAAGINDSTLVLSTQFLTGYYMDAGWSALTTYEPVSTSGVECNLQQILVGGSDMDYSLKQIGDPGILYREYVADSSSGWTVDQQITTPVYSQVGYTSVLRGVMPFSVTDMDKIVRKIILGHYTQPQTTACIARLRVGISQHLVDVNLSACDMVWHNITPDLVLECSEPLTPAQMEAQNLVPSLDPHWDTFERGRYMYFEISVLNADGTPALGADTHWHKIDFETMVAHA